MSRVFADHVETAKRILDKNWLGSSTKPAPSLYPHQWNWDSGFIAIGMSHYDTSRAIQELETLFEVQWANGMVSQTVFNPEALGHYFPEPDFRQTERSPNSPKDKLTSSITKPPVQASAVQMNPLPGSPKPLARSRSDLDHGPRRRLRPSGKSCGMNTHN